VQAAPEVNLVGEPRHALSNDSILAGGRRLMAEYAQVLYIGPRYSAGGSPGASRGPGICLTRPTSMAGVIASTASASCAVKGAESTLWAAFAGLRLLGRHPRARVPLSFLQQQHGGAQQGLPLSPMLRSRIVCGGFTNLYRTITNLYAPVRADVFSWVQLRDRHGEP